MFKLLREYAVVWGVGAWFLLALMNPMYKKYDYGAGLPMVLLFAVLVAGLYLLWQGRRAEGAWPERVAFYLFLVFYLISFLVSDVSNLGFPELMAMLSAGAFFLLIGYRKSNFAEKFWPVALIGGVMCVMVGYIFYIWWPEPRMVGTFFNIHSHNNLWPNAFALFVLMVWPLGILLRSRLLRILLLSFLISGLYLSFSRGAWIAFAGQLILLGLFFWKSVTRKKVILEIVMIGALAFVMALGGNAARSMQHEVIDVEERAAFENSDALTSKQERVDFWLGAIEMIEEEPAFGYGPFSFRYVYNGMQRTFLGNSDHPHNFFLKIGAENGLLALGGLGIFGALLLGKFAMRRPEDRKLFLVLGVAAAGGLAHNLIDYNFNFMVNLVLFLALLGGARSLLVKEEKYGDLEVRLFSLGLAIYAVAFGYQWMILDDSSLYPRYAYLEKADIAIHAEDYGTAFEYLDRQEEFNVLDDRVKYLRGVIYCREDFEGYDLERCLELFGKALELNPQNEIGYYRDYLRALIRIDGSKVADSEIFERSVDLVDLYFGYVQNNVHFTGYTANVEAADELIDILWPYLDDETRGRFAVERVRMMEKAEELRGEKKF